MWRFERVKRFSYLAKFLTFINAQCIFVRCDTVYRLPSLGVSSLDLGRSNAAPFFCLKSPTLLAVFAQILLDRITT